MTLPRCLLATLPLFVGCTPAAPATTIEDLESQLIQQVQHRWPEPVPSSVRISVFSQPAPGGAVNVGINIDWPKEPHDTHIRSTGTAMTLYRAADKYLLGTIRIEDKPPVNVVLRFK